MDWGWNIWVCALSVALACSSNDPPTLGDDSGMADVGATDAGADTGGSDDAGDADDASPGTDGAVDDAGTDDAGDDAGGDDAGEADAGEVDAPSGCSSERPCTDGSYCVYGGSCGDDGPGTCMPIGDFCPADCPGVCGCDGRTYCNACVAGRSGVDVDPDGDCAPDRGCASSAMCPLDEYCELESCDGDGLCRPRPEFCPAVIDPVCACNGMTYNNGCEARRAGQAVARAGACETDPT